MDQFGIATTPEEVKGTYGQIKHELAEIHFTSEKEIPGLENHPRL